MRIVHKDLRHGQVKVAIENPDDLWYLSQVIMPGDGLRGSTIRKIKVGSEESSAIVRKRVTLAITAEKVEFTGTALRALGTISEGTEDIPRGSHHSFSLAEGDEVTIIKEEWLGLYLEKLAEACEEKTTILICVFDRESALFGILKPSGHEIIARIEGEVAKKAVEQKTKGFYPEIAAMLTSYVDRYKPSQVVLASPSFWKEEFFKEVKLDFPVIQATCSTATENAFSELMKRDELAEALKQARVAGDSRLVEEVLGEIGKDGKASYGLKAVQGAALSGAVELLLVTDGMILKARENGRDREIDMVMRQVERTRGKVHILYSEHEPGKRIDGLGGMAAMLRYKI